MTKNRKCYSRSGWWQTLCGKDAANQGFGWTSDVGDVGCEECLACIKQGDHLTREDLQVLKPKKPAPRILSQPTVVWEDLGMRVVRRAGEKHYFDVEVRGTDAMKQLTWRHLDSFGLGEKDDISEVVTPDRHWSTRLLARLMAARAEAL